MALQSHTPKFHSIDFLSPVNKRKKKKQKFVSNKLEKKTRNSFLINQLDQTRFLGLTDI